MHCNCVVGLCLCCDDIWGVAKIISITCPPSTKCSHSLGYLLSVQLQNSQCYIIYNNKMDCSLVITKIQLKFNSVQYKFTSNSIQIQVKFISNSLPILFKFYSSSIRIQFKLKYCKHTFGHILTFLFLCC